MSLSIKWQDVSGIERLGNALGRLNSHEKHLVLQRAVNHTGDKARTQVIRVLAKQTGLSYGTIKRAVRTGRAWGAGADAATFKPGRGSLVYVMTSTGGDISLKFFKARETRAGVTAAPKGQRKLFPKTFMKGGKFPNRKTAAGLNGHVYKRAGSKRGPLEFQDSGVSIPAEMLQGASASAFTSTVEKELPVRVMREISHLMPGIFI